MSLQLLVIQSFEIWKLRLIAVSKDFLCELNTYETKGNASRDSELCHEGVGILVCSGLWSRNPSHCESKVKEGRRYTSKQPYLLIKWLCCLPFYFPLSCFYMKVHNYKNNYHLWKSADFLKKITSLRVGRTFVCYSVPHLWKKNNKKHLKISEIKWERQTLTNDKALFNYKQ